MTDTERTMMRLRSSSDVRDACQRLGGPHLDPDRAATEVRALSAARQARQGIGAAKADEDAVRDVVSAALVKAGVRGAHDAIDRLIDLWHAEVLRWCRWNADRGVSADDAAHDVLVRVISELRNLREPLRFRAWLWGVTWRVLKEHGRRSFWKRFLFGETVEETSDGGQNAETGVLLSERASQVREVLEQLAPLQRQLLWMHYVEERTRGEISELLAMPEGTVGRHLTAARRAFERSAAPKEIHDGRAMLARSAK